MASNQGKASLSPLSGGLCIKAHTSCCSSMFPCLALLACTRKKGRIPMRHAGTLRIQKERGILHTHLVTSPLPALHTPHFSAFSLQGLGTHLLLLLSMQHEKEGRAVEAAGRHASRERLTSRVHFSSSLRQWAWQAEKPASPRTGAPGEGDGTFFLEEERNFLSTVQGGELPACCLP